MEFIEGLFGISPDGGNGNIEASLIGLVVLGAVVLLAGIRSRHLRRKAAREWTAATYAVR